MKHPLRFVFPSLGAVAIVGIGLFVRSKSAHAIAPPGVVAGASSGKPSHGAAPAPAGSGSDRVVAAMTTTVIRKDVPIVLDGLGTATPLQSVTVKTQVDGRLDKVLFTEGKPVKKGEVLAFVDQRPFAIQLHQAQAALVRDEATFKNGQLNLERYETLRKQNLIPQQQLDDQKVVVSTSEAGTHADKAQIEQAQLLLDYSRITSPIDGVTGIRQVDPGNLVHTNDANGIVVITQIDPIAIIFTLPEDDLARVQRAMHEGPVTVDAFARDGRQKLASGTLLLVDNQVNAQTATIRLKATVPNPDSVLWPNAFVKARMNLTTLKNALVVPATTVQRGPSGTFVYVVSADNTVQPRPIAVRSMEGETAIVETGLEESEIVVTDGQNQLRPGSKVAPRPSASSDARPTP